MSKRRVEKDERTIAVEHAAGHYGYLVMMWLLVLDLGLHGVVPEWTTWKGFPVDLLVIILGGTITHFACKLQRRSFSRQGIRRAGLSIIVSSVVAIGILLINNMDTFAHSPEKLVIGLVVGVPVAIIVSVALLR